MLTPSRAGEYRQFVSLQSITARVAAGDGYTDTWTTYASNVPAAVIPATASDVERLTANTHQLPITHFVKIRYRSDLLAKHRVLFKETRALYILGMQNEEERDRVLMLSCEERAA